jgi:PPOX class probable F420-dependent enzyme
VDWQAFMSERPLGVLATVGADGTPHAVPVEVVVHGGKVYAWSQERSVKVQNVRRSGRAAMLVYRGNSHALVRGPARLLHAGDAGYDEITRAFLTKYEREETYGNDVLVEVSPDRVVTREK